MTSRSDLAQEPPRTGQDLSAFPAVDGPVARQWRAHSVEYGPWFFGATGAGRFDLPDTGDEGTCYFADDVETAVRERLGPRLSVDQTVTPDLAAAFVVSALVPPEPRRCAATTEAGELLGIVRTERSRRIPHRGRRGTADRRRGLRRGRHHRARSAAAQARLPRPLTWADRPRSQAGACCTPREDTVDADGGSVTGSSGSRSVRTDPHRVRGHP